MTWDNENYLISNERLLLDGREMKIVWKNVIKLCYKIVLVQFVLQ